MKFIFQFFCLFCINLYATAQPLAFPGAEGWGANSVGGRGCEVVHVTTLNDSGPGSFRDAVAKPNHTIVFDVAGVIHISRKIWVASNITIAGQTAPGDGIVIYGNGVTCTGSHDIIIRYVRFRGSINMPRGACSLAIDKAENVIIDHCSVEWGRWDNLHIKESKKITIQYCLDGEGIDPQRFGALLEGPEELTIHHCLWIDNQSRNPKAKAGIQFINNVVYNWGSNGLVGGHSAADHYQDVVGNYFIAGPGSSNKFIGMFTATDHVFQLGNYTDLDKDGKLNGREVTAADFTAEGATLLTAPHQPSPVPVKVQPALDAYKAVLEQAGASLVRDAVDLRLVDYVKSSGTQGQIVKNEAEAGGLPAIRPGKALLDTDRDGMPDSWERAHMLNPDDPSDGKAIVVDSGYTNLEVYLNSLANSIYIK